MSLYELEAQRAQKGVNECGVMSKLMDVIASCNHLTYHEREVLKSDLEDKGISYFVNNLRSEERRAIERGIHKKGISYFLE